MSHLYGFAPDTIDEQWGVEVEKRIARPCLAQKGKALQEYVTEIAITDSYRRLLKRGAITVKNFYSRATGINQSDEAIAVHLGVPRERLDRWRNKQSGRIDPLLYFMLFVSDAPNALEDWTKGLVNESVLACIREVSRIGPTCVAPADVPDKLSIRFMVYCFGQSGSHYRLFSSKDRREDALAEYLLGYFRKDLSLVRKHEADLARTLFSFGYPVFAVLHHLPVRAIENVLGS